MATNVYIYINSNKEQKVDLVIKEYKLIRFICEVNFENGSEITERRREKKNIDLKGNDFS